MPFTEETVLFRNPDDSISITRFIEDVTPTGVERIPFITRVAQRKANGRPFEIVDMEDIKAIVRAHPQGHIDKLRYMGASKQIDPSIELPDEARNRLKSTVRVKLKNGTPLTDEEIDVLL